MLRDLRVTVGGRDYSDHVERKWSIIRRTGVRSEGRFRVVALPGEIVIPRNGEEVLATATLSGSTVTLFGGYLDEPEIDAHVGRRQLYEIALRSIGYRARLDDTLLTQAQGIDIVQEATAAEQIAALVAVLAGEGFTSSVTLPAVDTPDGEDMRLQHVGPVLDRVSALNGAIPVVSASKAVSVVARGLVTGDLVLDEDNVEVIRVEDSRQQYRTSQVTRGGDLLRSQSFAGRADGRYRLGGVDNLQPSRSLFDDTVTLGNGVLWQDGPRARGGDMRGSAVEAILIETGDSPDMLPSSVVSGADRSIARLSLEAIESPFEGPLIPGGAVIARATTEINSFNAQFLIGDNFAAGALAAPGWEIRNISIRRTGDRLAVNLRSGPATVPDARIYIRISGQGEFHVDWDGTTGTFPSQAGLSGAGFQAFAGDLDVDVAVVSGPVGSAQSIGLRLEGVNLTAAAESDLGIAMQASDGTEYGFRLSDLTGAGGDDSAPYFWPLAVLPFANVAEVVDAIETLRAGESRLVIVDTTDPRIDFGNRVLLASETVIEIEATSIHTLDVDGTEVNLGGEGATWHWVQALQEVQETPPSATPPTSVNIRYRARWICRESEGTVPRVERVEIRKDLALPEDGRRHGRELLDTHGRVKETLIADLIVGLAQVVPEGSGVTLAQELIDRVPQVVGLTPTDVLRVERVEMSAPEEGDKIQQQLRLLRRADESRYRDDWRRALLERVGTD